LRFLSSPFFEPCADATELSLFPSYSAFSSRLSHSLIRFYTYVFFFFTPMLWVKTAFSVRKLAQPGAFSPFFFCSIGPNPGVSPFLLAYLHLNCLAVLPPLLTPPLLFRCKTLPCPFPHASAPRFAFLDHQSLRRYTSAVSAFGPGCFTSYNLPLPFFAGSPTYLARLSVQHLPSFFLNRFCPAQKAQSRSIVLKAGRPFS